MMLLITLASVLRLTFAWTASSMLSLPRYYKAQYSRKTNSNTSSPANPRPYLKVYPKP